MVTYVLSGFKKKGVDIDLGVRNRPWKFVEKLSKYSDWDATEDSKSHLIPLLMKYAFCNRSTNISEQTAADDFLYEFDFEKRTEMRYFDTLPGKHVVYFQLIVKCQSLYWQFQIKLDVYANRSEDAIPQVSSSMHTFVNILLF